MKRNDRFNPELGLAGCMLDVHVRSRFLAREEVEAIAPDPENRRTHATRIAQLAICKSTLAAQKTVPKTVPPLPGIPIQYHESMLATPHFDPISIG